LLASIVQLGRAILWLPVAITCFQNSR
jgi:hypothetical protein